VEWAKETKGKKPAKDADDGKNEQAARVLSNIEKRLSVRILR